MPTTLLRTYAISNRGPGRVVTATVTAAADPDPEARIRVTLNLEDAVFNDPAVNFWYGVEVQDATQTESQPANGQTPGMVVGWRFRFGGRFEGKLVHLDRQGQPTVARPGVQFYLTEIAGLTARLLFDPMGVQVRAGAKVERITG